MIKNIRQYVWLVSLFIGLSGLAITETAYAKSTSDPNHKGWSGKYPKLKQVDWKPIEAKCKHCTQMVAQYNNTVSQLLVSRYWVKYWRSVQEARESGKTLPFWSGKGDITSGESQAVSANLELFEHQKAQFNLYRQLVLVLEQQASYLRAVIIECELTACGKAKKPKIKDIKIGGDPVKVPWQPNIAEILTQYGVDWRGPYSTNCLPCKPIVIQLNAVPGWIVRAHMKLQLSEQKLKIAKLIKQSNAVSVGYLTYTHPDKTDYSNLQKEVDTYRAELKSLGALFKKLLNDLATCEAKYCALTEDEKVSLGDNPAPLISLGTPDNCNSPAAHLPIIVGANEDVGSKANFKQKAKNKLAGGAASAVSKLIGLGGGGGGKSEGPVTYDDPVKKKQKTRVRDKKAKRDLLAGGVFIPQGLLISNDIKKAPGKGTFHTIYLENSAGWRLQPIALYMYEIWGNWKLSVSWTRDTYIDGEHVKHERGGWTESWRELIAQGEEVIYGEVPLWEQLGFTTAVSGAKSMGTLFPVTPQMLVDGSWNLVIHVSDPKKDPVVTVPYVFELSAGKKGSVVLEQVDQTSSTKKSACS